MTPERKAAHAAASKRIDMANTRCAVLLQIFQSRGLFNTPDLTDDERKDIKDALAERDRAINALVDLVQEVAGG